MKQRAKASSRTTVRIDEKSWRTLHDLAESTGDTMQSLLSRAIEDYRRRIFLEQINTGYARLRQDPKLWAEVQAERKAWDAAQA
jgi:hypothetical protein